MNKFFIILFSFFLFACVRSELSPEEYLKWFSREATNIEQKKEFNELSFSARYVPNEYFILKNLNKKDLKKAVVDSLLHINEGLISFIFKINVENSKVSPLKYNIESNEEYNWRVQYCSFNIAKDFLLVNGTDTISCIDSQIERSYDLSPFLTFVLHFDSGKASVDFKIDNLKLIYYDNIWNCGIMKFAIKKSELESIPKLKLM